MVTKYCIMKTWCITYFTRLYIWDQPISLRYFSDWNLKNSQLFDEEKFEDILTCVTPNTYSNAVIRTCYVMSLTIFLLSSVAMVGNQGDCWYHQTQSKSQDWACCNALVNYNKDFINYTLIMQKCTIYSYHSIWHIVSHYTTNQSNTVEKQVSHQPFSDWNWLLLNICKSIWSFQYFVYQIYIL